MNRIQIVGSSGTGKSYLAQQLSQVLAIPRLELDSIFHLENWKKRDELEFQEEVTSFICQEKWVIDGNYSAVRDHISARAEILIHLDYPVALATFRVIRRSLRRIFTKEILWNGNRENWSALLSPKPTKNLLLWMWLHHRERRILFSSQEFAQKFPDLKIMTFKRPHQAKVFLRSLV